MIGIDGVFVQIGADDVEVLASFYEKAFGLARAGDAEGEVVLSGRGLRLRIVLRTPQDSEDSELCLSLDPSSDLDTVQTELSAAGALVLSESKRGDTTRVLCQDPAGNELMLIHHAVAPGQELAVRESSTTAGSIPPRAAGRRVTRRDFDRLRDEERLASMRESIAGLSAPFSSTDPAAALDAMRAKIGNTASFDEAAAERDAALRKAEADELFRKYQSTVNQPVEEEVPPPASPVAEKSADGEDDIRRPSKTLGRSRQTGDTESGSRD